MKMAAVHSVMQSNDSEKKYTYGKVNLSLENCILPPEKLSPSPSFLDGLDPEAEIELRILGCEWIQTSGILLRLPQVAMATGQVLFQRFFYSKSFVRQSMEVVAMACIALASKIEEAPRRIRDVSNVFHHIKQVKSGKTIQPLILDQNYINLKNQVIKAERRVLKELGFCVHVKHPHKIIVTLLEVLKVKNRKLMQAAWNYMNDSLRSEVFVRFHPETIACACIHLSAKLLQIALPNKPAWYLVFGVDEQDINDISIIILSLYTRRKPDAERLEKLVEDLRKAHMEAKQKAKELAQQNSRVNSTNVQSASRNGTKSPASDRKKDRSDKHNDVSPRTQKDVNHRKRPTPDSKRPSSSSGGSASSRSPSPKKKQKTPPRGFKNRSRSRSKSRNSKKSKHRSSHKRKRTPSPNTKMSKTLKNKHSDKSRSRSHERTNHHSNSVHEKSKKFVHEESKSRRDRLKENHHSRDKKRR